MNRCEYSSSQNVYQSWIEIHTTTLYGLVFFFQAEDGIRDAQESRGLGDVYKRQSFTLNQKTLPEIGFAILPSTVNQSYKLAVKCLKSCLLYTSDAADDLLCVDLGGRRIIKKKKKKSYRDV